VNQLGEKEWKASILPIQNPLRVGLVDFGVLLANL